MTAVLLAYKLRTSEIIPFSLPCLCKKKKKIMLLKILFVTYTLHLSGFTLGVQDLRLERILSPIKQLHSVQPCVLSLDYP